MSSKKTNAEIKTSKPKKLPPRTNWPDLILDTISCWFLTTAIVLLLYAQFLYSNEYSLTGIMVSCGSVLVALALITRRKWIFPALLGVGVVGGISYLLIAKKTTWFIKYVIGFSNWLMSGMNNQIEKYATSFNYYLVQVLICIGIALLVFLFVRMFHSVFFVVVSTSVLYIYSLLSGAKENNMLTLMFLAAGTMPLVAANFYNKHKVLRSIFGKKKAVDLLTPNWRVQTTAVILCSLSVLVSVAIVPKDTSNLVNRTCANYMIDIQSATNLFTVEQKDVAIKNLGKLNLQRYKKIGGELFADKSETEPFEDKVIAYVSNASAEETYLKSAIFETYDGLMWHSEFSSSYRLNGLFFKEISNSTFNDYITGNNKLDVKLKNNITTRTIRVMLAEKNNHLIVPSGVVSFKELTTGTVPVVFNKQSEIFSFKELPSEYEYEVVYSDAAVNIDKINAISEITSKIDDEFLKDKDFIKTYTQLPDNFPVSVSSRAAELTKEATSDYAKVAVLTQHLCDIEYYKYTNKLPPVPDGTDITLQLLRTRKGNSPYYATTLTMMARSLGIPSRLVAGYRVSGKESLLNTSVWNAEKKAYEVSEDDAFCWTECYIKGIGWVAFYPSPVSTTYANNPNPPESSSESDRPEEKPQRPPEEEEEKEEEKEKKPFKFSWKYVIISALVVAAIFVLLFIRSLFVPLVNRLPAVKRRFHDRVNQAEYYIWDINKQLACIKRNRQLSDTTSDIISRIAKLPCVTELSNAYNIIDSVRYARSYTPTEEEIIVIYNANRSLERVIRKQMNPFAYFFKRRYFRGDKITFVCADLFNSIKKKISSLFKKIGSIINKIKLKIQDMIRRREG